MHSRTVTLLLCVALLQLTPRHVRCDRCSSELDVDYRGIPWSIDLIYEPRRSFQECCALCDAVRECLTWTFVFRTKVCVLKKGLGYRLPTMGSKSFSSGDLFGFSWAPWSCSLLILSSNIRFLFGVFFLLCYFFRAVIKIKIWSDVNWNQRYM